MNISSEKLLETSYLIRRGCNYGCDNYGGVGSSTVFAVNESTNITSTEKTTVGAANGTGNATAAMTPASADGGTLKITLPLAEDSSDNKGTLPSTNYEYKIYKVFDATQASASATNASYKIKSGKSGVPNVTSGSYKFVADSAGNIHFGTVTTTEPNGVDADKYIKVGDSTWVMPYSGELNGTDAEAVNSAVKDYVKNSDLVADLSIASSYTDLTITGLPFGYYYVTTSTGALVALNSTVQNATVGDKNTVPTVDKTITSVDDGTDAQTSKGSVNTNSADTSVKDKKAIAEAGSTVHFQSVITVGKGAANYVFKDKLDDTLALNTDSGKITVSYLPANATQGTEATTLTAGIDYTLDTTSGGTGTGVYTFGIQFNKDTEPAKAALTEGAKITISYSAIVKSDGLQTNPAKNTAWVSYGNDPNATHDTVPSETETYNAKVTLEKRSGSETGDFLANAGFKLKNGNTSTAKYYKLTTTGETPNQTKAVSWVDAEQGDQLYSGPDGKLYTTKVYWVGDTFTAGTTKLYTKPVVESNGTVYEADDNGSATTTAATEATEASFTGLTNGTYYLEETTVPSGYNKATDTQVTINDANAEGAFSADKNGNLNQVKEVINQTGSLLPSTGGIGTTIFYVIGGVLIAGAAILLITRRKKA